MMMNKNLRISKVFTWVATLTLYQILFVMIFGSFSLASASMGQEILNQNITILVSNKKVKEVLHKIEERSDIRFVYSGQLIDSERRVSLNLANKTLGDVLLKLLKPLGIVYEVSGRQIILDREEARKKDPVATPVSSFQEFLITGNITDENDIPLPGAGITIKGSQRGTSSDAGGNFSLQVADKEAIIVISYIGYKSQEITVGSQNVFAVKLALADNAFREVVVVGYGSREKRDITGSVSSIKADEISKSNYVNPEMAMQGRMTGVQVTQGSGDPNARPQVRIRGVGTFGNTEPLYVVDGVPINEFGNGTEDGFVGDVRGNVNILSTINPADIESISVLKDAAASAVYGVRAAHGVILITTRKGKLGKPKVDINISKGVQNIRKKYELLNVQQLTDLTRQAYSNNKDEAANLPAEFNPSNPAYLGNRPTTDWVTPAINKNAVVEDYSVRISGGTEATKYYVSGGYSRTESPMVNNYLERYSMTTNIETKINKYLSFGVNNRSTLTKSLDNTQTDIAYLSGTTPWQPIYDPNGPHGFAQSYKVTFKKNEKFVPTDLASGAAYDIDKAEALWGPETNKNPFATQNINRTDYAIIGNIANGFLQIEPIPGLKLKGTVGLNWFYNRRNTFESFDNYLFSQTPSNPYANNDGTSKGSYFERHTRNLNLMKELSLNYSKTFRSHMVDVLLVANQQQNSYQFLSGSSNQIISADPLFRTNIGGPIQYTNAGAFRDREALIGYMGRVSYNFKHKYYFDGTLRRDGSSKFAPGFKWGIFPGVSAAWRISEEGFMKRFTFISDLKLRAGTGKLGNDKTASFAFLSTVSNTPDYALGSGNGNGLGTPRFGASLPDFPNRDLSWETATTTNIGLDGSLFSNKLGFTVEYYNKLTSGILQSTAVPASVGNQNQPILNIASVRNSGFEFQLNFNHQIGDIQFNASGNLTTVKNEVVSVFKDQPFGGEYGRIEVGNSLNYLWGYQVGGVFQNQGEIDAWKTKYSDGNNNNNFQPGDMYFKDVKGPNGTAADGIVNAEDRSFIGKTIPGYYYGLNLGANWRGVDASVFFQGVGDVVRFNDERAAFESMAGSGNNYWASTLDRWSPENPSNTMPRAVRSDPAQNNRFSNRFVESVAFLRLKNVQIGYTLPKTISNKLGSMENCRIYISGTNLLTFTKWSGLDPESRGTIPPTRAIQGGLSISF